MCPLRVYNLLFLLPVTPLAYRAVTRALHPCLSLASFWRVPQLLWCSFISASTVRRQVTFGLPLFLFPSGVQKRAVFMMDSGSLLSMWPIQVHRLLVMMVAISSWSHLLRRSWFEMVFGQNTFRILLRDLVWKVDSLLRSFSVILQHSEPYRRIGMMQLLYSLSFVLLVYWLDFHTACKFLNAALAFASLCWMSLSAPPSVVTILPK